MHDSIRGRGRTRPEYLVNKRRPIETKVPGVRVVTRVQLFSIRHYKPCARCRAFPLERIRFPFDRLLESRYRRVIGLVTKC